MSFIFTPFYVQSDIQREFFTDDKLPDKLCQAQSFHVITSQISDLIPSMMLGRVSEECRNRAIDYKCYYDSILPDIPTALLTFKGRAVLCERPDLFYIKKYPRTHVYDGSAIFDAEYLERYGQRIESSLREKRQHLSKLNGYASLLQTLYEECLKEVSCFIDVSRVESFLSQILKEAPPSRHPSCEICLESAVSNSKLLIYKNPSTDLTFFRVNGCLITPMLFLLFIQNIVKDRYSTIVSVHPFARAPLFLTFPEQKLIFGCYNTRRKGIRCDVSDFLCCESEVIKRRCAPYQRSIKAIYALWDECRMKYLECQEKIDGVCAAAIKENAAGAFAKRLLIGVFCDDA